MPLYKFNIQYHLINFFKCNLGFDQHIDIIIIIIIEINFSVQ